jgi:hypothetical protein
VGSSGFRLAIDGQPGTEILFGVTLTSQILRFFARLGVVKTLRLSPVLAIFIKITSERGAMFLLQTGLVAIYVAGAWIFWRGFRHTHYSRGLGNQLKFTLLWPVFMAISGSYRQNFQRALRGD